MDIEQLRKEYHVARDKAHKLGNQVDTYDNKLRLENKRTQFEGKCFKFHNSYGYGSEVADWWVYFRVQAINDDLKATVVKFEDNGTKASFEIDEDEYHYEYGTEITEQEYHNAFQDFKFKHLP